MVRQARDWATLPPDRALHVLDNLRMSEAREALRAGPDEVVPFVAIYARGLGDELADLVAPLLASGSANARTRAVRVLTAAGSAGAAAEAVALLPESSGLLRQAIVAMIAAVRPTGGEAALRDMLEATDLPGERALALSGLAAVATAASQTTLVPLLADEDPLVRTNAARALGRLQDDDVAAAIRARLKTEKDPRVREQLTISLGAQSQPVDLADLKRCLAQPIRRVDRAICLDAIAACDDPEAVRALVGILATTQSDLRREAAIALGHRPDDAARTALLSAAEKEEDPTVVRFIVTALGRLKENRARERCKAGLEDPNVAFFCALALAELGDPAGVPVLRLALKDADYRERALAALGSLKDVDSAAAIEEVCAKERRPAVRALALQVLAGLPGT